MNGLQQGFVTGHKAGCPFLHSRCTCGDVPTEMASLVEIKTRLAAIERQQKETQEGLLIWMEAQREAISAIEQSQREESKLIFNAIMGFNERVKVIEQGQSVLCERLDARSEQIAVLAGCVKSQDEIIQELCANMENFSAKLDCLQGKELLSQFKTKPKRRKREAQKGR